MRSNHNHPRKGSSIKVEPIRERTAIERIKARLRESPRDYCLFVLGINTGHRANELLSITCGQVRILNAGDALDLKERKTKKHRTVTLNRAAIQAIRAWLAVHPDPRDGAPLFRLRTGRALTVSTVSNMVKCWCAEADLHGNYGSHTLRKTWGFHQLRRNTETKPQMVLPILMQAYGHASQEQTLEYLCVQAEEVARLFMQVEL
jgi:integrase